MGSIQVRAGPRRPALSKKRRKGMDCGGAGWKPAVQNQTNAATGQLTRNLAHPMSGPEGTRDSKRYGEIPPGGSGDSARHHRLHVLPAWLAEDRLSGRARTGIPGIDVVRHGAGAGGRGADYAGDIHEAGGAFAFRADGVCVFHARGGGRFLADPERRRAGVFVLLCFSFSGGGWGGEVRYRRPAGEEVWRSMVGVARSRPSLLIQGKIPASEDAGYTCVALQ